MSRDQEHELTVVSNMLPQIEEHLHKITEVTSRLTKINSMCINIDKHLLKQIKLNSGSAMVAGPNGSPGPFKGPGGPSRTQVQALQGPWGS